MSKSHEQRSEHTNPWLFALQLGFYAGLIWGGIHWLFYGLHFTKVSPGFMAEPFFKHDFLNTVYGHLVGYAFFIVFSIIAALLYALLLRKLKGPWPGLIYGLIWWAVIFIACSRLFLLQPPLKMPWNTFITELCIFLLWGMFIGYTVAIEYTDERKREQGTVLA